MKTNKRIATLKALGMCGANPSGLIQQRIAIPTVVAAFQPG
ncbi:MAG TPA: hypothetical protein VFY67_13475 [Pyrinomonadaceae bacterium]|nr:hypothetical protein [Pyrinomonadaceae bacterium]